MDKITAFFITIFCVSFAFLGGIVAYELFQFQSQSNQLHISQDALYISHNMKVLVCENSTYNRTLYLNASEWYCKVFATIAGDSPYSWDCYPPKAQIVDFVLEDVGNKSLADNYRDIIISMNPVLVNETMKMVIAMYYEGGYAKYVYYNDVQIGWYMWNKTANRPVDNHTYDSCVENLPEALWDT
jgi:hypothetical protein